QKIEENRVMGGNEKTYFDLSEAVFGRQRRHGTVEYFFHILKRESPEDYEAVNRADRGRVHRADPKRMKAGKPTTNEEFVDEVYAGEQPEGVKAMTERSEPLNILSMEVFEKRFKQRGNLSQRGWKVLLISFVV